MLWSTVDAEAVADVLVGADRRWLATELALLPLVPAFYTVRLLGLLPPRAAAMSAREAGRVVLVCQLLNAVLPSKGGELVKGWFLTRDGVLSGYRAASLILVERLFEAAFGLLAGLLGLLLLPDKNGFLWGATLVLGAMVSGLLALLVLRTPADFALHGLQRVAPGRWQALVAGFRAAWREGLDALFRRPGRLAMVAAASFGLATLYLGEAWVLLRAVGADVTLVENAAYTTLSSVASALPLTVGGIGTRDAAAVALYADTTPPAVAAAFGVLLSARQLGLAALGLPVLPGYLARRRRDSAAPAPA